ncbi:MAG: hypothetical protein WBF43_12875 [Methylocella sp.]
MIESAEAARRLRETAARLMELADVLDGAAPAPPRGREHYFLDTGAAMRVARKSSSWLYANGKRYGFGWRLKSGAWAFSRSALRSFLAGSASLCEESEFREISDASPLPVSREGAHDAGDEF